MHLSQKLVAALLLPVFLISSPAFAQQPGVVDSAVMAEALANKAGAEDRQRELVLRVLETDEARQIAARLGLDLADASSAIATLGGGQLANLAQQAGAVESAALAGGNTIVISLTTLLLILIIVLLVA